MIRIAENQFGIMFVSIVNCEYAISGDKKKFLSQIKQDLQSEDPIALLGAHGVLDVVNRFKELPTINGKVINFEELTHTPKMN